MVLWAGGSLWTVIVFAIVTTLIAMTAISFAPDRRDVELDEIGASVPGRAHDSGTTAAR